MRPLTGIEIDKVACSIYNKFVEPEQEVINKDISEVATRDLPEVSVIVGCPPCQGFSNVNGKGRKEKNKDNRNRLILEYIRIVQEKKPLIFFFENVPPVKKSTEFGLLLKTLSDDYNIYYSVVDLGLYGGGDWFPLRPLSHRRRLICVGILKSLNIPAKRLVPEPIADTPLPLKVLLNSHTEYFDTRTPKVSGRLKKVLPYIPQGGTRNDVPENIRIKYFYPCWLKTNGFRDVLSRPSADKPLPYVTGGILNVDKGPYVHPTENRGFTVDEAKVIMSFPPDLNMKDIPLTKVGSYIGNAFPPQPGFSFGRKIKEVLEEIDIP